MQDLVMYADIYMGISCLKVDEIFNVDLENLVIDAKGNKKLRFGTKIAPSIPFKNSFRYRRAKFLMTLSPITSKSQIKMHSNVG